MSQSINSQSNLIHSDYEEYLESIVDTIREALLVLDRDLRVVSANQTFYQRFLVDPKQTEGRLVYELGNGQWNIPELRTLLEEILPTHNPFNNFRVEHKFPRLGRKVMLLNARQIQGKGEWKDHILLAIEDVTQIDTDKKEREAGIERERKITAELTTNKLQLEAVFESIKDGIVVVDQEKTIILANQAFAQLHHRKSAKQLPKNISEFQDQYQLFTLTGEELESSARPLNRALKGESLTSVILRRVRPQTSEEGYFLFSCEPITGANGNPQMAVMVMSDITSQIQAEESFHKVQAENEHRKRLYEALTSNTLDLMYIFDLKYRFIYANEALLSMWGKTWDEAKDKSLLELGYEPWHAAMHEREIDTVIATKRPIRGEVPFTHAQLGRRIYDYLFVPVLNDHNEVEAIAGTTRDITEITELSRQKDEFIGIASHELKTPVTSIKAYGQVLQTIFTRQGDDQAVESLKKMDAQINKLTNLIGDLLDVTKIQSGRLEFHQEYFDFNAAASEVIDQMQLTTERHQLKKRLGRSAMVYGDKDRLGQVITNLLSNAIKYSPHSDQIIISSKVSKGQVILSVRDYGVGIPDEKRGRIFEQFYRVSGPQFNTVPGLGLGLYISSEIVKRQSGQIWVESQEGKGSTFYFSLPLSAPETNSDPLIEEEIRHE